MSSAAPGCISNLASASQLFRFLAPGVRAARGRPSDKPSAVQGTHSGEGLLPCSAGRAAGACRLVGAQGGSGPSLGASTARGRPRCRSRATGISCRRALLPRATLQGWAGRRHDRARHRTGAAGRGRAGRGVTWGRCSRPCILRRSIRGWAKACAGRGERGPVALATCPTGSAGARHPPWPQSPHGSAACAFMPEPRAARGLEAGTGLRWPGTLSGSRRSAVARSSRSLSFGTDGIILKR
jgi:hypothetical protein